MTGIYPDWTNGYYQAFDAASASRLSLLARSPAHLKHALDNPEEPTPALALGTAFHCLTLQPDVFIKTHAVAPECDRRTKEGKATWERFCADSVGKAPLKADDYARCVNMANAVLDHRAAAKLLTGPGAVEVSAVWFNDLPSNLCKLRADKLADDFNAIVDLKTTDDASPEAFERNILRYGYHRQAAFYLHGLAALGAAYEHFVFVCVEKDPPHAVGVYRLDDDAVEAGWAECVGLLETYFACRRDDRWPAYPAEIQTISLPAWHMRRLEYGRAS